MMESDKMLVDIVGGPTGDVRNVPGRVCGITIVVTRGGMPSILRRRWFESGAEAALDCEYYDRKVMSRGKHMAVGTMFYSEAACPSDDDEGSKLAIVAFFRAAGVVDAGFSVGE